jgi:hypothetical protein
MEINEKPADQSRRGFLKLAATAAPAAALTVVSGHEVSATEAEPEGAGLRKTAHVKAYLASARF